MSVAADELADRIRQIIGHKPGVVEKRMFGGVGFMLNGNMVAGAMSDGELMLRAEPGRMDEMLKLPGAAPLRMGERTMSGFYTVDFDSIADEDDLKTWLDRSWTYVQSMPAKAPKASKPKPAPARKRKSPGV